ncbi:hypothetical protein NSK11_contig00097-0020 [Nocardia seriolae]|uniref:DUF2218 domain-containing protein n=2 Tax=Nocardia seriolae TaxID=37332 RepID=A0ABC9YZX0_9NOCA|nr:DUF2218 domain-containing protein [Nocardia seriolae]RLP29532.1 DUF2218 domain-containing protein [Nocardia seriolae]GAM48964.1 hypothetical protein NS07_v2contig00092-0021 [Nocardia seriolae]GAP30887.1 hypothetical protein NSK11_contig00097-0020 [Nocardia seriolae]
MNPMPSSEARISTDRPARYLAQFCKHAAAMADTMNGARAHRFRPHGGTGEHEPAHQVAARGELTVRAASEGNDGTVEFTPWGRAALHADATTLTIRIDATGQDELRRIQELITDDLNRFTRRQLDIDWLRIDSGTTRAFE